MKTNRRVLDMGKHTDDEIEIDIKEMLYLMREKLWLIILMGILGATATGLVSAFLLRPVYTSSTMLYIINQTTTLTSLTDLQMGTQLTKDYKVLVTSRPVAEKVIENLNLNIKHTELTDKVTISNPTDTRILTIAVEHTDPFMAKAIADEFAEVSSQRIAEIMDMKPPKIVEDGELPTTPTSPNVRKNILIGGVVGCMAAMMAVTVLFVLNDSIKSADDVEKYLGLTTLGMIPVDENSKEKKHSRFKKRASKGGYRT